VTAEGEKKKACIRKRGVYVSTPLGDSMKPMLLGMRDSVAVEALTRPVRRGDVLLYETADGRHLLHRVVGFSKEGYLMRGDNCYTPEPPLSEGQIIGILTQFWRKGKPVDVSTSVAYRLYVGFWRLSYPLRWLFFRVKNGFARTAA